MLRFQFGQIMVILICLIVRSKSRTCHCCFTEFSSCYCCSCCWKFLILLPKFLFCYGFLFAYWILIFVNIFGFWLMYSYMIIFFLLNKEVFHWFIQHNILNKLKAKQTNYVGLFRIKVCRQFCCLAITTAYNPLNHLRLVLDTFCGITVKTLILVSFLIQITLLAIIVGIHWVQ